MKNYKTYLAVAVGAVTSYALLAYNALAQTIVTWDATDTDAIVQPMATSFKTNAIYLLKLIGPYAIGLAVVFVIYHFFARRIHKA